MGLGTESEVLTNHSICIPSFAFRAFSENIPPAIILTTAPVEKHIEFARGNGSISALLWVIQVTVDLKIGSPEVLLCGVGSLVESNVVTLSSIEETQVRV